MSLGSVTNSAHTQCQDRRANTIPGAKLCDASNHSDIPTTVNSPYYSTAEILISDKLIFPPDVSSLVINVLLLVIGQFLCKYIQELLL